MSEVHIYAAPNGTLVMPRDYYMY